MIRVSSADEDKRIEIILRLRRYRSKVAEYQACKELYDSLYPSSVQHLSDMPSYRSDVFEPERWAQRRMDQAERMQTSLNEMRESITELEQLAWLTEGDYKTVLIRRYFLNESMEVIAEKMHYSIRWCWGAHDKAIGQIIERTQNNGE